MTAATAVRCPACHRKFRVSLQDVEAETNAHADREVQQAPGPANTPKRPPPLPSKRKADEAKPDSRPTKPARSQQPVAPPKPPAVAVEIPESQRQTAYLTATGLVILALLSLYPAGHEIVEEVRRPSGLGVDLWAWLTLALGLTHLAYGLYLAQLPDWSAALMTLLVTAAITACYAAGLGLFLMARPDNATLVWLGLADELAAGYAKPWCLGVASLYGVLAIVLMRVAAGWHRRAHLLTRIHQP
jgi:hypothetical protein